MLFKDHLYAIQSAETSEQGAGFRIRLNAGHTVFASHFPGYPILPGACVVQMVAELVTLWQTRQEAATWPIVRMSNLKFLAIVSPDEVSELKVKLDIKNCEEGMLKVTACVCDDERDYSKMTLTFAHGT